MSARPHRRRSVLAAAALALPLLALHAGPAAAQRSGLYDVEGTNLDGTPYTGVAEIQQVGLASFRIVWQVGDTVIEGAGMASGHTISVVYGTGQHPGFGIYTLSPDGTLTGEWTLLGANAIGRETLRPRADQPDQPAQQPPADSAPPAGR